MKWRDITVFDGHSYVAGNITADFEIPVSGFNTVQAGPVNLKLGMIAGEGDRGITGDYFQIRNHQNTNWITLSKTSGLKGSSTVKISVAENSENSIRSATVTIIANGVTPVKIAVTQKAAVAVAGNLYPSYNNNPIAADAIGMSSTATEIASKIKLGWNLGNTLEASGSETAWGNPKASKALIDAVKLNGFNAVRIPCSWNQYLSNSDKAEIKIDGAINEVIKGQSIIMPANIPHALRAVESFKMLLTMLKTE